MTDGVSGRLVASCCGLGGFATAVVAGMAANNPLDEVLTRALISLFACAAVGMVIGAIAERTITDAIRAYTSVDPKASNRTQSTAGAAGPGSPPAREP